MIPLNINEFLKKNQMSREEAIAELLRDWAKDNNVSMTAVVSTMVNGQAFNTVAFAAFDGPRELLLFHRMAHVNLVEMTLKEKDDEDL